MNFVKLHKKNGRETLVNLDIVTDIYTRSDEVGCNIHFSENDYIEVDETLEQMQNLIKSGEKMNEINDEINLTIILMQGKDEVKSLTEDELKSGGWWCKDVSRDCAEAIESKGLKVFNLYDWGDSEGWSGCSLDDDIPDMVSRKLTDLRHERQIHRIGNEFYWEEL